MTLLLLGGAACAAAPWLLGWYLLRPRRFRRFVERLRWAARTARHATPRSIPARIRLLWHDFVVHALLHRGGERCQDCGRSYVLWTAPKGLWQRVMGGPSGLLCPACFDKRAKADGLTVEWLAHVFAGYYGNEQ